MRGVSRSPSVYWHDSGVRAEFDEALDNGAVGLTLNPFLAAASARRI